MLAVDRPLHNYCSCRMRGRMVENRLAVTSLLSYGRRNPVTPPLHSRFKAIALHFTTVALLFQSRCTPVSYKRRSVALPYITLQISFSVWYAWIWMERSILPKDNSGLKSGRPYRQDASASQLLKALEGRYCEDKKIVPVRYGTSDEVFQELVRWNDIGIVTVYFWRCLSFGGISLITLKDGEGGS